jgi:hypothetical protein
VAADLQRLLSSAHLHELQLSASNGTQHEWKPGIKDKVMRRVSSTQRAPSPHPGSWLAGFASRHRLRGIACSAPE